MVDFTPRQREALELLRKEFGIKTGARYTNIIERSDKPDYIEMHIHFDKEIKDD